MTRERDRPDRHRRNSSSQRQAKQSAYPSRFASSTPSRQQRVEAARQAAAEMRQSLAASAHSSASSATRTVDPMAPPTVPPQRSGLFRHFRFTWQLGVILGLLVTGGLTTLSLGFLFKLPAVPNCPEVFWPLASASLRMHCAQLAANKATADDLLEAIKLLNTLPADHPMHEEAMRLIETWSADILKLGDDAFNAGKLDEAIAIAKKVPENAAARKLVDQRIDHWKTVWEAAETIATKVEDLLRKQDWRSAFTQASRLLSIDNNFWQTTKYQELTALITSTREDGNKLGQAKRLMEDGGLDNLLEAIKLATSIEEKSFIYQDAQTVIPQVGRKMLDLAQTMLDRKDLTGALNVANRIPETAGLKDEIEDFRTIATAQSKIWSGRQVDLEDAIAQLQRIDAGRPLHLKAQDLASRWQADIAGTQQLEKAKQLAQGGSVDALRQAVSEASQVPSNNPRGKEAQQLVDQMTSQIQDQEDRPFLDRAEQLAAAGDANGLQSAISTANQILPGRSLYDQAQTRIKQWTNKIQRLQDDPILTTARERINAGDLTGGIETARQISTGRAASEEAQSLIDGAQTRMVAEQSLQQARAVANGGTIEALESAISLAQQVPSASPLRTEANQAVTQWSQQILQAALSQADADLLTAIATAQRVPNGTPAYADAQRQITLWRKRAGQ
jgi:tetratricopeptide (TPR) repeat protein